MTIPSVVILKLIAYDDRPEHRLNDPIDIDAIIAHYPSIETELIWDDYHFLYNDDSIHDEIGVKVLGHEMSKIIAQNEKLTERVLGILNKAITLKSQLAERMIQDPVNETLKSKIDNLKLLKDGIEEGLKRRLIKVRMTILL